MLARRPPVYPERVLAGGRGAGRFDRSAQLHGLHVLVVEDEADTRELLTAVLSASGARVTAVASAAEALDALERQRPDAMVCDIGMPGEDGYALIESVRGLSLESGGRIPAVALTAHAAVEDRIRALSAGYQIYLRKPVEPAELVAVLASLTRERA